MGCRDYESATAIFAIRCGHLERAPAALVRQHGGSTGCERPSLTDAMRDVVSRMSAENARA